MKSDLDRLMQDRGFAASVVMGRAVENTALNYITSGAKITQGIVLKKRGEGPVLICGSMERDEAAKSGLPVVTFDDFDLYNLVKETGSRFEGKLRMLAAILEQYGVTGAVSFYGLGDPGQSFVMLSRLSEMLPSLTITGEAEPTIFDEAGATTDAAARAAIKSGAERTNTVMAETVDFLKGHTVHDSRLVKANGGPLTVGDVKRFVRVSLLEHELEASEGIVFAIGRDAGIPHSQGEDDDHLVLGKSIVFDLFPRGLGGGYFHDMTRTFCLGYAPPEVQRAYDQVMQAFEAVMGAFEVGEKTSRYQDMTCDILEEHGRQTVRSDPGTEEGYVHSLGHGIGLQIHSEPYFSPFSTTTIQPGQVFTVEPGLYYPEQGYGVRVEDTVYVDEEGTIRPLTTFPKDLVIPVG